MCLTLQANLEDPNVKETSATNNIEESFGGVGWSMMISGKITEKNHRRLKHPF